MRRWNVPAAAILGGFAWAGCMGAAAFPYPVAGPSDDPNFCSSRAGQSVIFCVTPPAGAHCEVLENESTPLYLGYRYWCDPAPDPSAQKTTPADP